MGRHSRSGNRRNAKLIAAPFVAAIPLIGAAQAPAHAATNVWDALAKCESSGNWSINSGNGYYGGLQFSPRTWVAFGGSKSALPPRPGVGKFTASRSEQIRIAQRVQASVQGWNAWPGCNKKLGLARLAGPGDTLSYRTSEHSYGTSARASRSSKRTVSKASRTTSKRVTTRVVKRKKAYTVVRPGDTLFGIGMKFDTSVDRLMQLNKGKVRYAHLIYVKQVLRVR